MTGKSHNTLISGSISIDKIINKYGTYTNVLGGSASYALCSTPEKTCQLIGVVGNDFPEEYINLANQYSISLSDLRIAEGKTFTW